MSKRKRDKKCASSAVLSLGVRREPDKVFGTLIPRIRSLLPETLDQAQVDAFIQALTDITVDLVYYECHRDGKPLPAWLEGGAEALPKKPTRSDANNHLKEIAKQGVELNRLLAKTSAKFDQFIETIYGKTAPKPDELDNSDYISRQLICQAHWGRVEELYANLRNTEYPLPPVAVQEEYKDFTDRIKSACAELDAVKNADVLCNLDKTITKALKLAPPLEGKPRNFERHDMVDQVARLLMSYGIKVARAGLDYPETIGARGGSPFLPLIAIVLAVSDSNTEVNSYLSTAQKLTRTWLESHPGLGAAAD